MPRKKIAIDETQVRELARLGATNVDIGKVVGCSEATVRARFCDELELGRAERRNTLHKWQWGAAAKGNVNMLIWLGKQELGQSDKTETKHEFSKGYDTANSPEELYRVDVHSNGRG